MQVYPTTGKLRLARATPYFNNIGWYPTQPTAPYKAVLQPMVPLDLGRLPG